ELVESIAELITTSLRLNEVSKSYDDDNLSRALETNTKSVHTLRDRIVAMRMIPLRTILGQTNRIVHDEAARHDKKVAYVAEGLETTIDRAAVDVVTEAVGHIVRN